ncbi:Rv3654c family TadE-like protein [Micromonospora sp. CPCC 206061]|uniref:Rv3654c family TadE-like protein n=1 Tax=Micromonospora sp. CPCC 206061 TaxID=3122410 RepID=UPI002FF28E39
MIWSARFRRDEGAATLWVLAIGLVFVVAGLAGAAVGAARVAKHQAQAAADLGALAGAARVVEGEEVACRRAADLVGRNGGRLTRCVVEGFDVILAVEVKVTPLPGMTRTVRKEARAGPIRARAR